jgi:putative ABC transport system ATP-binding protein
LYQNKKRNRFIMIQKDIIASVQGASKIYQTGDTLITALAKTHLDIYKGQLTLLVGASGSGKTTLLSLLGCVIYPTEGNVFVNGKQANTLSTNQLANLRLRSIGFVFQSFNLIAPYTALQNVMTPLLLLGLPTKTAKQRATEALIKVGLGERLHFLPKRLSGGQQQRVAIARALVTNAPLILCDEPTASLDSKSVGVIMQELKALSQTDRAVVVVTHDHRLFPFADRIIYVSNGQISETPFEETSFH